MKLNNYGGLLVAFDGPNGVGKTTIIKELFDKLVKASYSVKLTKEPTESILGMFARKESENISGEALACLVAADRYEHIEKEIIPSLNKNEIVLCDRYILSSFILQGMDGVKEEFIANINDNVIIPNIQISLVASIEVIQSRLSQRKVLTRFEKNNKTSLELGYLNNGTKYLNRKNVEIHCFNTENELKDTVFKIFDIILSHINEGHI